MSIILALDTSNYTTSACVYDSCKGIIWESRIPLHVPLGACGVRQNDAVFLHTRNLRELFKNIPYYDYYCFAASNCPSEKENSYMPCFNVGVSFASALSDIYGKKLFLCSHQKNHIASAALSANCTNILKDKFIAYHVSGGTTDILLCSPECDNFSVKRIGGTADISCGQLIDRIGTMLGMQFPCGKQIELHSNNDLIGNIKITSKDNFYNFSGFQNKAQVLFDNQSSTEEISTFCLEVIYSFLINSISFLRKEFNNIPIIFSGGVMSNSIISSHITKQFSNVFFSKPYYSVDNASGTAYLCSNYKGTV